MNNAVRVRFWGARGSIPSPDPQNARYSGDTSCVELRVGNQIIILDAGSGIRRLGSELAREFGARAVEATLLVSHMHWDHIQGLPFFRTAYSTSNRIQVFSAFGKGAALQQALHNQMSPLHFPVSLAHLAGLESVEELPGTRAQLGDVVVRTTELNHPGGCTGFRLETRGLSVVYLPDHEPYCSAIRPDVAAEESEHTMAKHLALVEFARGCDLLILDAQYDRDEYPARIGWGHGCLDDTVQLAVEAQAQRLALFHHDPDHNDEKIDAMLTRARRLAAEAGSAIDVRAARALETVTLQRRKELAA